jgi:DNA-binding CsgD family transcriptional regulator
MRTGSTFELEHGLTPVAAELYQRLSTVLYDAADYRRAEDTLTTALDLCRAGDQPVTEVLCVTCMVYVLRECGEWPRALEMGRELIATDRAVWMAEGLIGVILGRTNREIAQALFLSPRTVDMHVRNLLRKLDCRSRIQAARRAGELGLLV